MRISSTRFTVSAIDCVYTYKRQDYRLNEIVRASAYCVAFADVIDRKSLSRTARVSHTPGSRFSWYYFISDSSIVVHNNIESASMYKRDVFSTRRSYAFVGTTQHNNIGTPISTHENRRYTRVVHNLYRYYIMYVYTRATPFWRATHSRDDDGHAAPAGSYARIIFYNFICCYYYYLLLSDLMAGARQKY